MIPKMVFGLAALGLSPNTYSIPHSKPIVNSHYPKIIFVEPTLAIPMPKTNQELIEQNHEQIMRSILIKELKEQ